jgi:hypothetical protein
MMSQSSKNFIHAPCPICVVYNSGASLCVIVHLIVCFSSLSMQQKQHKIRILTNRK